MKKIILSIITLFLLLTAISLDVSAAKKSAKLSKEDIAEMSDTIDRLTTALTAAQALHGMDKQQAVIEVNQTPQEPEQQASVDNTVTTESTKKNSLFARLFKRRRE